ncbi:WbqC family protein [Terasakiella pusilla]|uniref:WbqC family protein n=1 Tax=Terasakiella pusilla TaxID=64973 RepID=UPI003AA98549
MIVAIHQPNFFPWMGYFDKIKKADVFVFLDEVQLIKSGNSMSSWTNRVQINVQNRPHWINCPLVRFSGNKPINDVVINVSSLWQKKLLKTIKLNYAKAPNGEIAFELIKNLMNYETDRISNFNVHTIKTISAALGMKTKFVMQSDLGVSTSSTQLLIDIVKEVGGTTYLCGGGASGYQEDDLFIANNLELRYQNFAPTSYVEEGVEFIPGLSVIDYLMMNGKPL